MKKLCSWRYEKAERIHNSKAKIVSIAAGLLIQKILFEQYGLTKDAIQVELGEYGKPILLSGKSDHATRKIHFNISHSGEYVVAAVSDENIGIDIECKKDENFRVAKRCFTDAEYEYIMDRPEEDRMRAFRDIWTMKESFLKYTGTGISVPLNSFSVDVENRKAVTNEGEDVYFTLYRLGTEPTYSLSLCCKSEKISIDIQETLKL